jgi:hypothetical protein
MKLSVLLATAGRHTLHRTLASLSNQAWQEGDEVMVVTDACHDDVLRLLQAGEFHIPWRHIPILTGPHKDWGHTPRNLTMKQAQGDYISHFDDDDVALPSMVSDIHSQLTDIPSVHMFRMIDYKTKNKVWTQTGLLRRKYISTQNIVHPNDPRKFGRWARFYGGDSVFIIQTAGYYPGHVHFHDVVTCVYNPLHHLTNEEVQAWFLAL